MEVYWNRRPCSRLGHALRLTSPTASIDKSPNFAGRKRGHRGGSRRKIRGGRPKYESKVERLRRKYFNVGYWNCRSVRQRKLVLDRLVYDFDVLMLQETQAAGLNVQGFCCYVNPVSDSHHGQAIIIRNTIAHSVLDVHSLNSDNIEVQGIQITIAGKKWNVVNVYIRPNVLNTADDWDFLTALEDLPGDYLLVCGDFNSRNIHWNNINDNPQGKALDLALMETNLTVVNRRYMTRLATRSTDTDSNIDLALVSAQAEMDVRWDKLTYSGSDHLPCAVGIYKGIPSRPKKISHAFTYDRSQSNVLGQLRQLAWKPKTSKAIVHRPPWWTQEIETAWIEKRRALKRWQTSRKRNINKPQEVKGLEKDMREKSSFFQQLAEETKRERWYQFTKEVAADKASQKFWTLYARMNKKSDRRADVHITDNEGKTLTSDEEKGRAFLARYIAQTDQGNSEQRKTMTKTLSLSLEHEMFYSLISQDNVVNTIRAATDGSPGPDGVRYSHLKLLGEDMVIKITDDFNQSIISGSVPEEWLHSYLVPQPKPGKDKRTLSGYRIITMQNVYGKVLEKIISRRLASFLESNGLLPNTLGGYRQGRDTMMNASILAYDVYERFQSREESALVALDLEDAYNRVDYEILISLLMGTGFDVWFVRWIASVLIQRKVALRFESWTSEPCYIVPGLPQGSPLSPVLFNIYTARIAQLNRVGLGRTLTFADDILTYIHGKDRIEMVRTLQTNVNEITDWCNKNKACINPTKASVMWCSLNNKIVKDVLPNIYCNGDEIVRDQSLRYLGITFDRTLCFKHHVAHIIQKTRKGVTAIKVMANAKLPQNLLVLLMNTLVLAVMDYGLGLLTLSTAQITKLERIQNEAMRAVLGCTKDTPIRSMQYLLDLPSITVRHKYAQVRAYLRVAEIESHALHSELQSEKGSRIKRGKSWMAEAEDTLRMVCELEDIRTGNEWVEMTGEKQKLTKVIIKLGRKCRDWAQGATEDLIRECIENNSSPQDPIIYTDGSVSRGQRSGWGFIAFQQNRPPVKESGFSKITTSSMRMEIEAATAAISWLSLQSATHAVIVTDSQSMLRKIEKHKLRKEWVTLLDISQVSALTWIFCPGHTGVCGNEIADKLASGSSIECVLTLDKKDIAKQVLDSLRQVEEIGWNEDVYIKRLVELGVEKGSGRSCTLDGRRRRIYNQHLTGTISRFTLQEMLKRAAEWIWACPDCKDADSMDRIE